jgi:hypothetical protein
VELNKDKLQIELNSWTSKCLIEQLIWKDRNGVCKNKDSLLEFDNILGKVEAISIITKQIS